MHGFEIILTIITSLGAALVLGYITHRIGLSPIVGYLLAGLVIGPYTPGFVGNVQINSELAEVGVILLMFVVGLQFHWRDLLAVKAIAIPGAIAQSIVATIFGILVGTAFGWSVGAGLVLGIAIAVASTVVLIRVLTDNNVLATPQGHSAVGWLVVEDIFTVIVLVLLPATASILHGTEHGGFYTIFKALFISLGKLAVLALLMAMIGSRVIPWIMETVARSRSKELFTLAVLVMAIGIAAGSAWIFGASLALGAFLAGIVINRSPVGHQAISDVLPMRDAFAVLFFVSVGMLFDPRFLIEQPGLVLAVLGIILLAKPLTALLIVVLLGHPVRTALTVAIGLAQIGEFSFILSSMGRSLNVLPDAGQSVLVAGALISITLNPLLFRNIDRIESYLQRHAGLWRFLTWRVKEKYWNTAQESGREKEKIRAVVVGYGPVGQTLTRILNDFEIKPVIIEMNVNTVKSLIERGYKAIYGDGSKKEILEAAGVGQSEYLLITLPEPAAHNQMMVYAKEINPDIRILVRAQYLTQRKELEEAGVYQAAYEELEIGLALADLLLREIGLDENEIAREAEKVRIELTG
jgi:monovalent cation:H+ antiporter-2, CPA2 family